MSEKEYLIGLKYKLQSKPQPKRVVCGFNEDSLGRAVVTTGVPREFKEGVITYVDQKTMSYEDYITSKFQEQYKRR